MIDLELAKKIGATHCSSIGRLYKKGLCNFSEFNGHSWEILHDGDAWRIEIEKVDFNPKPSIETLQSALDKSQLKVMELTEQLAEAKGVGIDLDELCEKYYWILDGVKNSDEHRLEVKGKLAALIIETTKSLKGVKPTRTKVDYVKCEFEHAWQAVKAFEEDVKMHFDAAYDMSSEPPAMVEVASETEAARYAKCDALYERTEVEIDWKDECVSYFKTTPDLHEDDCLIDLINENSTPREQKSLLEMCRVALRATGELTDKPQ